LAFGVLLLAVSCGARDAKPEPVTVTVFVGFSTGTDNRQIEAHRQLAKEFNAAHPDMRLEFVTANHAESADRYLELRRGGKTPDLVMPLGVGNVSAWQDEWLDLAPLLAKRQVHFDDFYETPLKAINWPASLKAFPLGVYPSVLYYNVDMFDRAHLPYPPHRFDDEAWTYDQLLQSAIRLTRDRSGKTPLDKGFDAERVVQYGYDGTDWSPLLVWPAKFGGTPLGVSDDGRSAQIDSDAWKFALAWLRDSIHTWFVRPMSNGSGASPVYGDNDPIGSNTTAMWEAFSWIEYAWGGWNRNFRWDVAAIPAGPTGRVVAQANLELAAIPASAAHPEQALDALLWLSRPETMKRLASIWGCIPTRKSLAQGWIEEPRKINENVDWQVFLDAIDYMGIPNHEAWVPAWQQIAVLLEKLQSAITSGQVVDTDQAAAELNRQVQGILDAWWKEREGQGKR
jgi:multiple sugar transport system substrate-binding protein